MLLWGRAGGIKPPARPIAAVKLELESCMLVASFIGILGLILGACGFSQLFLNVKTAL